MAVLDTGQDMEVNFVLRVYGVYFITEELCGLMDSD
jgi:hypothetical protein